MMKVKVQRLAAVEALETTICKLRSSINELSKIINDQNAKGVYDIVYESLKKAESFLAILNMSHEERIEIQLDDNEIGALGELITSDSWSV